MNVAADPVTTGLQKKKVVFQAEGMIMPLYLQILVLIFGFIAFVFLAMLFSGWGIRRVCFKIIRELEEAGAVKVSKAIRLQDERKNIFRVGTGNLRPKAIGYLINEGLVIKTGDGKYYLDKDKLAEMKEKTGRT